MPNDDIPTRVLVVEDEFVIALDLAQQLEEAGFQVSGPASNEAKALSLIDQEPPDIALLDINLGCGTTSYGIARRLIARHIPFAFLSGYSGVQIDAEFTDVPVLAKPCPIDMVMEVMQAMSPVRELGTPVRLTT